MRGELFEYCERQAQVFESLAHHLLAHFLRVNPEARKGESLCESEKASLMRKWLCGLSTFKDGFGYQDFLDNNKPLQPDQADSLWFLKLAFVCRFHAGMLRNFTAHFTADLLMKIDGASNHLLETVHAFTRCWPNGIEDDEFIP